MRDSAGVSKYEERQIFCVSPTKKMEEEDTPRISMF
jgi:hypothetical protein